MIKKSSARAVTKSGSQYRKLLNWIGDPVLVLERQTLNVLACNHAAERMYGYTPEEWKGLNLFDLYTPEDRATVRRIVGGWATERTSRCVHLTKDGKLVDVEVVTDTVDHQGGTAWICVIRDMSAHKLIESELEKARAVATESARLKSEFLSNVGHEVRTPLNGILGMTELLLSMDVNDELREYIGMVKCAARALLDLMTDILDFSLLEAGKLHVLQTNFDLRDSVQATLERLSLRAREKELKMSYNIAEDVPDGLVGDSKRVRQILGCLIDNAIKFTDHGSVVVQTEADEITEQDATLHFSVTDTGIGIPADRQAMIFDAFTQIDGSATRKYNGAGIGLTIASRLIEMMGGRIWVESEPGRGSTFHFTLTMGLQSSQLDDYFGQSSFADTMPAAVEAKEPIC